MSKKWTRILDPKTGNDPPARCEASALASRLWMLCHMTSAVKCWLSLPLARESQGPGASGISRIYHNALGKTEAAALAQKKQNERKQYYEQQDLRMPKS